MQLMFYRHLRWLLHTNDIHGRIEAHTPRGAQSPIGGLVHVAHVAASLALLGQRMKSNMGVLNDLQIPTQAGKLLSLKYVLINGLNLVKLDTV